MPGWDYVHVLVSSFYMGVEDLKSGSLVCTASTSPTKLPPQTLKPDSFLSLQCHKSWDCVWLRRVIDDTSRWLLPQPEDLLCMWLTIQIHLTQGTVELPALGPKLSWSQANTLHCV